MQEIKNAKIESTVLGIGDHGVLTCYVHLTFGAGGQGFGGYCMDRWVKSKKRRVGTAYGTEYILSLLKTVGVERYEDLPGKYVRIDGDWTKISRIGHIIEDKWFDPAELFQSFKKREKKNDSIK